jgi:hypothetical protein
MPDKEFYEPYIYPGEVEFFVLELNLLMQTEEWASILECLGTKHTLRVHTYDDSLDMHDGIYLTGSGFVDNYLRPVNDLKRVVEGFVMGYYYGASETQDPYRHPQYLIPWIRGSVARIKEGDQKKRRRK